jgi:pilus assembly protein Flp/PilA
MAVLHVLLMSPLVLRVTSRRSVEEARICARCARLTSAAPAGSETVRDECHCDAAISATGAPGRLQIFWGAFKDLRNCLGKNSGPALYEDVVFGGCPMLTRFLNDESGATAIEYGLIAGLIAVVIITAVTQIGTSLNAKFTTISTSLT